KACGPGFPANLAPRFALGLRYGSEIDAIMCQHGRQKRAAGCAQADKPKAKALRFRGCCHAGPVSPPALRRRGGREGAPWMISSSSQKTTRWCLGAKRPTGAETC